MFMIRANGLMFSLISTGLIALFLCACASRSNQNIQDEEEYYYIMSEEDLKIFSAKVSALNMGNSAQKVIYILGMPYQDRKMEGPKVSHDVYDREISYVIKKWRKDINNTHKDKSVYFYFDANNSLVAINSTEDKIESRKIVP